MSTNIDALVEAWPRIIGGVVVTAELTLGGAALAFGLALVLATPLVRTVGGSGIRRGW